MVCFMSSTAAPRTFCCSFRSLSMLSTLNFHLGSMPGARTLDAFDHPSEDIVAISNFAILNKHFNAHPRKTQARPFK